jgi:tetratricopeptide (TPR) repeat protein
MPAGTRRHTGQCLGRLCLFLLISLPAFLPSCAWIGRGGEPLSPFGTPVKSEFTQEDRDAREAYKQFIVSSVYLTRGDAQAALDHLIAAAEKDPDSVYLNRKAAQLLKNLKDYERARTYALKALELAPEDLTNRILLADIHALKGDNELAIAEYEAVLEKDPDNQRIRLLLATLLIRTRQLDRAHQYLERLIAENPNMVVAHYYRGRINLEAGRHAAAEASLLKALELNPTLEPALFDLGTLYQVTNRDVEAMGAYERLLESFPENMSARERLVDLYFKHGLKEKAETQMEKIKAGSKPGETGRRTLGLLYFRQGKIDESIEELGLIVSAWPDDHKSRFYLAAAYEERGDDENALEHFRKVPADSKYYINAQMHISYILESQEKYDEAIAVLEQAIPLQEDKAELYLMLASLHETQKAYDKAVDVAEKGLEKDPENIDLIYRLGVILDKSGDKAACIEKMRRILTIDPKHADAMNYIGYTYAEQGVHLEEAKALIQKAMELKPNSGYITDSLGWVYFQKGRYEEAVQYLEKASQLTPDDPTINEHLGDAYLKMEEYDKALASYKKALGLNPVDEDKLKNKIRELERQLKEKN